MLRILSTSSKGYNMTPSQAVAKARRELKKITNSDYAYLSNEYFIIGIQKGIQTYIIIKNLLILNLN